GRPAFAPTAAQRTLVGNLAEIGCTHDEICWAVPWERPGDKPLDPKTLRKHFADELTRGDARAKMRVRKKLYELAVSGENTAVLIFYAKTRLRMSETVKVENSGPNGEPLPAASAVAQTYVYLPLKDEREEAAAPVQHATAPEPRPRL